MNNLDGFVSLLIASAELIYIIFLLVVAQKNTVNKLTITTIAVLFGYQFFEFLICFVGLQNHIIIYLALADITILPPLGLYTVLLYSGKLQPYHKNIFYPAIFFIVLYAIIMNQLAVTKCAVLYASYHYPLGALYGTFYYLPIIGSLIILDKKWGTETDPKKKALTRLHFFGYIFTFIPSMVIALFVPAFVHAAESLLCKMAFILATFLLLFTRKNRE